MVTHECTMERIVNADYELVETHHGLMLCNRHDLAMTKVLKEGGAWAWDEIQETIQYATGTVVDIGANIGTHALVYARTAAQVISFEPQFIVYNNLCANLLLNNVMNVTPMPFALGSYDGMTTMQTLDPTSLNSTPGEKVGTGETPVVMRKLDSMNIQGISFIKIDCEAHELEVLKGGIETLKRDMPVLYIEVHYAHLVKPIIALLQEIGYVYELYGITRLKYPEWMYPLPDECPQETFSFIFKKGAI
jgi:FkbM family methyltransferase